MLAPIVGLHHVTAIASDPQQNLDFYTEVLGLRFVKRTVNFDDPSSYHLYFGDDSGSPGTILTFFAWPGASHGHSGIGEVVRTSFSAPMQSIDFWEQHLLANKLLVERSAKRFNRDVLTFPDPDGMKVEIIGHGDAAPANAPRFASIPPEHSIRGLFGVTLLERRMEPTLAILNIMGFHKVAEEDGRTRFAAQGVAPGNHIDVVIDPNAHYGSRSCIHRSELKQISLDPPYGPGYSFALTRPNPLPSRMCKTGVWAIKQIPQFPSTKARSSFAGSAQPPTRVLHSAGVDGPILFGG